MKKAIKRIAMLFMVCGLVVSVSFGAWIPKNYEENYQKLKAEVEEYGDVGKCKWDEDGKGNHSEGVDWRVCEFQKVLLFFDEIRATEGRDGNYDDFAKAVKKVREIPLFKNDSGIYSYAKGAYFNEKPFWESVWNNWESAKNKMEMDWARRGYWKKLAE